MGLSTYRLIFLRHVKKRLFYNRLEIKELYDLDHTLVRCNENSVSNPRLTFFSFESKVVARAIQ